MKKTGLISLLVVFVCLVAIVGYYLVNKSEVAAVKAVEYLHNEGKTQGTYYSATYLQPDGRDLKAKIEERLQQFEMSLSTYNPNSIISRINNNDPTVKTDLDFETIFYAAQEAAARTDGALDITVGPLVKAWGFAFGNNDHSKLPNVSDFLPYVGYKKVRIENHKVIKDDPRILIDANSIAQGYSVDVIAKLLSDNGCKNYMIEIGGEVACKGLNASDEKWRIGIDKAVDDSTSMNEELQTILSLTDCAVTTAGDYRKFYIKDGKKYSHIINPHTGYPANSNLLSVTIVAPTAIMADAYDTPFMVLGVDSCLKVCKSIPGMECYLIYVDKNGKNQIAYSEGFEKYLAK
ncbi:MAG: FAD:protein FMN transferase [Paludibacter sp.]|nr:FAD:protein FMN transferase [Paludibacter sp.]